MASKVSIYGWVVYMNYKCIKCGMNGNDINSVYKGVPQFVRLDHSTIVDHNGGCRLTYLTSS